MANPEHLKIIKQGAEVWNRWREENPAVPPDLADADLRDVYLGRANLGFAFLPGTNFTGADLIQTDFQHSYLVNADFGAAGFVLADLANAELGGANFALAKMYSVDLRDADLENAFMSYTDIVAVNLSRTKGLTKVTHHGPSGISTSTLERTAAGLSKDRSNQEEIEAFFRGAGVSQSFLETFKALIDKPPEFHSCFVSYSSEDEEFAKRLYADLQEKGVRCWFAPEDMKVGDKILDRIDQTIRGHDKVLLILSQASISSEWVEDEVTMAFEEERKRKITVLFPIRLDDAVMGSGEPWAAKIRQRHIGDFTDWKNNDTYTRVFERLLRDLKTG